MYVIKCVLFLSNMYVYSLYRHAFFSRVLHILVCAFGRWRKSLVCSWHLICRSVLHGRLKLHSGTGPKLWRVDSLPLQHKWMFGHLACPQNHQHLSAKFSTNKKEHYFGGSRFQFQVSRQFSRFLLTINIDHLISFATHGKSDC